jgi:hypothetical protein
MARRVFFSFHYEKDIWRANIVRNSWVTKGNFESAGFIDAAEYEKIKRQGDESIKRWINEQLEGTSVTVVLIGSETYLRDWVRYEIIKSFDRENALLGVYIHNMKNQFEMTDIKGPNPFEYVGVFIDKNGNGTYRERNDNEWTKFSLYPKCGLNFPEKYRTNEVYKFNSKAFNIKIKLYDWKNDDGYNNLGDWIEEAAEQAGR